MDMPRVQIEKLRLDAVVPRYMSAAAAGLDLAAAIDEPVALEPGQRKAIGTGLALAIPNGYEGQVRPRSGMALNAGVTVANAPGRSSAISNRLSRFISGNIASAPIMARLE